MIPYTIRTDATQFGNSHYEAELFCPRKARLDKEKRAAQGRPFITGPFGIGTLFHAFSEMYFGGVMKKPLIHAIRTEADVHDVHFQGECDLDPEAVHEAARCFTTYLQTFPVNHYGEVLFVEQDFAPEDKEVVEAAVGISPWTGQKDMGVRLSKKGAEFLQSRFSLDVKPGAKYLVDWKTEKAETQNLRERFMYRNQFKGYLAAQNAVEAKYGREPFEGLIADITIKTKVPKFVRVLCESPNEREIATLAERWRAVHIFKLCLPDWANASDAACFPLWGSCGHFLDGSCDRGPSKLSEHPLVSTADLMALAKSRAATVKGRK